MHSGCWIHAAFPHCLSSTLFPIWHLLCSYGSLASKPKRNRDNKHCDFQYPRENHDRKNERNQSLVFQRTHGLTGDAHYADIYKHDKTEPPPRNREVQSAARVETLEELRMAWSGSCGIHSEVWIFGKVFKEVVKRAGEMKARGIPTCLLSSLTSESFQLRGGIYCSASKSPLHTKKTNSGAVCYWRKGHVQKYS